MCRLLGLVADRPVDLRFSLLEGPETLADMSGWNPDGWGVGWYGDGGAPVVVREPRRASGSERFARTAAEARSRMFVAHVRRATTGECTPENTHPFADGHWIFAHNGSVREHRALRERLEGRHREALAGQTDSEVLFHWLLQSIQAHGSVIEGLRAAIEEVRDFTALNFLLGDGERLYAYRDARTSQDYYTLYWLRRDPTDPGPTALASREVRALLESKALRGERAVLVCSERLTDEGWREIPSGSLLVTGPELEPELLAVR